MKYWNRRLVAQGSLKLQKLFSFLKCCIDSHKKACEINLMSAWINCNWFKKCQTKLRDKWDWRKYLSSIQHSKELLSIIYRKFLHFEKKKTSNSTCIWISNLQNRKSKKEKEKTWAASLVVSEIQIKRTTPHHYSHIGMANITQSKLLQPFRR